MGFKRLLLTTTTAAGVLGVAVGAWGADLSDENPPPTAPTELAPLPLPDQGTREAPIDEDLPLPPIDDQPIVAQVPKAQPSSKSPAQIKAESEELASKLKIPRYARTRPSWGVQLATSLKALGGLNSTFEGESTKEFWGFNVTAEYEPKTLQDYGVLSFGPTVGIYPTQSVPSDLTNSAFSVFSVGGQARYQFRYFREQPFVPFASVGLQVLAYHLVQATGNLTAKSFSFGGLFLLNWLDTGSANYFYDDVGVCRSYLVAEGQYLIGTNTDISLAGMSMFFGLRLEF